MGKPAYRVPSMAEINASAANGYRVASLFSGCGGSSLGYRLAGFKVVWANEFIPAAADCYRANFPEACLDTRDIRQIKPAEILAAIGIAEGELDVLDGSPPCASFSTAGKREEGWGKVKAYSETRQRVDDLFFEYARLLAGIKPKVFVAENVSGLVKGVAKGYFKEILAALKACGYRVRCRVLDAQWLGVPQMRQRTIFIGVREDLPAEPAFPKPLPYRYSVRDAIGIALRPKSYAANDWIEGDEPAAAIQASGQYFSEVVGIEDANGYTAHAYYAPDRPMDTVQAQRPVRIAVSVPDYAGDRRARTVHASEPYPSVLTHPRGWNQTAIRLEGKTEKRKFTIEELKAICSFPADFILTGTYAQQWERLGRAVPPLMMRAIAETVRGQVLGRLDHAG